ncbi:MAG: hypothetical protein MJ252_16485 [archaeon]|nr:hypothetical protein [archaeon]
MSLFFCKIFFINLISEYVLGYDFTETMIAFTPKRVLFYVASKKSKSLY